MEIELHNDFKDFLKLLNSQKVEYLVVGGYAVGFHGYIRSTGDLDVWIATSPGNAARVADALQAFGFGKISDPAAFNQPDKIFRMGLPPVRIEILTTISGIEFRDAFARRVIGTIDGVEVAVPSLEDLKTNKRASGRLKDLADIQVLETRKQKSE